MARKFTPKVITSNDLLEGDVIYLTEGDAWTRQFGDALLYVDEAQAAAALARVDEWRDIHVGAYLAEAEAGTDGRPRPTHFREKFRATGPSINVHGNQAEAGNV